MKKIIFVFSLFYILSSADVFSEIRTTPNPQYMPPGVIREELKKNKEKCIQLKYWDNNEQRYFFQDEFSLSDYIKGVGKL